MENIKKILKKSKKQVILFLLVFGVLLGVLFGTKIIDPKYDKISVTSFDVKRLTGNVMNIESEVKSYDKLIYHLKFTLQSDDNSVVQNRKAIVTATLTDEEVRYAAWNLVSTDNVSSELINNGKTLKLEITGLETNKEYTQNIVLKTVGAPNDFEINPRIEINESTSTNEAILKTDNIKIKTSSISGTIKDLETNELVNDVNLALCKEENDTCRIIKQVTSTDGNYLFSDLASGRYKVLIVNNASYNNTESDYIEINEDNKTYDITTINNGSFKQSIKKYVKEITINTNGKEKTIKYENLSKVNLSIINKEKSSFSALYEIKVKNEGTKSGFVKVIKEEIPNGMELDEEYDGNESWTYNNGSLYNKALSKTSLKPNEEKVLYIKLKTKENITENTYTNIVKSISEQYHVVNYIIDNNVVKQEIVLDSDKIAYLNIPDKDGYETLGWYTDSNAKNEWNFNNYVTNDMNLYATYKINTNKVTLNNPLVPYTDVQNIEYGDKVKEPNKDNTVEGYTFKCWQKQNENNQTGIVARDGFNNDDCYNFDDEVTEEMTLVSVYTIDSFTITFMNKDTIDGEYHEYGDLQSVDYGHTITLPEDPSIDGYEFAGWYESNDNGETLNNEPFDLLTPVKKDITLYSDFSKNVFEVTFKIGTIENGTFVEKMDSVTQRIKFEEKVSKPSDPILEGYVFDDWYTTDGLTVKYDFDTKITDNTIIYGNLNVAKRKITYLIPTDEDDDDPDTPEGWKKYKEEEVDDGDIITPPEEPELPYCTNFTGDWYLEKTLENLYNFSSKVTKDLTLYAGNEEREVTVTYLDDCGEYKTQTIKCGETPEEVEKPKSETGKEFKCWVKVNSKDTCQNEMDLKQEIVCDDPVVPTKDDTVYTSLYGNIADVIVTHEPTTWTNDKVTVSMRIPDKVLNGYKENYPQMSIPANFGDNEISLDKDRNVLTIDYENEEVTGTNKNDLSYFELNTMALTKNTTVNLSVPTIENTYWNGIGYLYLATEEEKDAFIENKDELLMASTTDKFNELKQSENLIEVTGGHSANIISPSITLESGKKYYLFFYTINNEETTTTYDHKAKFNLEFISYDNTYETDVDKTKYDIMYKVEGDEEFTLYDDTNKPVIDENTTVYARLVRKETNEKGNIVEHIIDNIDKVAPRVDEFVQTGKTPSSISLSLTTTDLNNIDKVSGIKQIIITKNSETVETFNFGENNQGNISETITLTINELEELTTYQIGGKIIDYAGNETIIDETDMTTDEGDKIIIARIIGRNGVLFEDESLYEDYTSLNAAITSCGESTGKCTIQMVRDTEESNIITSGQFIAIDLNAKKIMSDETYTLENEGSLEIADSTGVPSGGVYNTTDAAIHNLGTLLVGDPSDDVVYTTLPIIEGETVGVKDEGTFGFFDGILKGNTLGFSGTIDEYPDGYNPTTDEGLEKQETTLAMISKAVAKIKRTGVSYTTLDAALNDAKIGEYVEEIKNVEFMENVSYIGLEPYTSWNKFEYKFNDATNKGYLESSSKAGYSYGYIYLGNFSSSKLLKVDVDYSSMGKNDKLFVYAAVNPLISDHSLFSYSPYNLSTYKNGELDHSLSFTPLYIFNPNNSEDNNINNGQVFLPSDGNYWYLNFVYYKSSNDNNTTKINSIKLYDMKESSDKLSGGLLASDPVEVHDEAFHIKAVSGRTSAFNTFTYLGEINPIDSTRNDYNALTFEYHIDGLDGSEENLKNQYVCLSRPWDDHKIIPYGGTTGCEYYAKLVSNEESRTGFKKQTIILGTDNGGNAGVFSLHLLGVFGKDNNNEEITVKNIAVKKVTGNGYEEVNTSFTRGADNSLNFKQIPNKATYAIEYFDIDLTDKEDSYIDYSFDCANSLSSCGIVILNNTGTEEDYSTYPWDRFQRYILNGSYVRHVSGYGSYNNVNNYNNGTSKYYSLTGGKKYRAYVYAAMKYVNSDGKLASFSLKKFNIKPINPPTFDYSKNAHFKNTGITTNYEYTPFVVSKNSDGYVTFEANIPEPESGKTNGALSIMDFDLTNVTDDFKINVSSDISLAGSAVFAICQNIDEYKSYVDYLSNTSPTGPGNCYKFGGSSTTQNYDNYGTYLSTGKKYYVVLRAQNNYANGSFNNFAKFTLNNSNFDLDENNNVIYKVKSLEKSNKNVNTFLSSVPDYYGYTPSIVDNKLVLSSDAPIPENSDEKSYALSTMTLDFTKAEDEVTLKLDIETELQGPSAVIVTTEESEANSYVLDPDKLPTTFSIPGERHFNTSSYKPISYAYLFTGGKNEQSTFLTLDQGLKYYVVLKSIVSYARDWDNKAIVTMDMDGRFNVTDDNQVSFNMDVYDSDNYVSTETLDLVNTEKENMTLLELKPSSLVKTEYDPETEITTQDKKIIHKVLNEEADTIIMLSDVAMEDKIVIEPIRNLILDLNGKELTWNTGAGKYAIENRGNMVITDTSDSTNKGKISNNGGVINNSFDAALEINAGTMNSTSTSTSDSTILSKGNLILNEMNVIANKGNGIYIYNEDYNIEDVYLKGTSANELIHYEGTNLNLKNIEMEVSGATNYGINIPSTVNNVTIENIKMFETEGTLNNYLKNGINFVGGSIDNLSINDAEIIAATSINLNSANNVNIDGFNAPTSTGTIYVNNDSSVKDLNLAIGNLKNVKLHGTSNITKLTFENGYNDSKLTTRLLKVSGILDGDVSISGYTSREVNYDVNYKYAVITLGDVFVKGKFYLKSNQSGIYNSHNFVLGDPDKEYSTEDIVIEGHVFLNNTQTNATFTWNSGKFRNNNYNNPKFSINNGSIIIREGYDIYNRPPRYSGDTTKELYLINNNEMAEIYTVDEDNNETKVNCGENTEKCSNLKDAFNYANNYDGEETIKIKVLKNIDTANNYQINEGKKVILDLSNVSSIKTLRSNSFIKNYGTLKIIGNKDNSLYFGKEEYIEEPSSNTQIETGISWNPYQVLFYEKYSFTINIVDNYGEVEFDSINYNYTVTNYQINNYENGKVTLNNSIFTSYGYLINSTGAEVTIKNTKYTQNKYVSGTYRDLVYTDAVIISSGTTKIIDGSDLTGNCLLTISGYLEVDDSTLKQISGNRLMVSSRETRSVDSDSRLIYLSDNSIIKDSSVTILNQNVSIVNPGSLLIENTTINGMGTIVNNGVAIIKNSNNNKFSINNTNDFTLDNVDFDKATIINTNNFTIKDCNIIGSLNKTILTNSSGTTTISGETTLSNTDYGTTTTEAPTVLVNGGVLNLGINDNSVSTEYPHIITPKQSNSGDLYAIKVAENAEFNFYDGLIEAFPEKTLYGTYNIIPEGYDVFINNEKDKMYLVSFPYVKIISGSTDHNDEEYANIREAINDCDDNEECVLKLIENKLFTANQESIEIPSTKNITIDFDNHFLTSYSNNDLFINNGSLKFIDNEAGNIKVYKSTFINNNSSFESTGVNIYTYNDGDIIDNSGIANITAAVINSETSSGDYYITNEENSTLTINVETLNRANTNAIKNAGTLSFTANTVNYSNSSYDEVNFINNMEGASLDLLGGIYNLSGNKQIFVNTNGSNTITASDFRINKTTSYSDIMFKNSNGSKITIDGFDFYNDAGRVSSESFIIFDNKSGSELDASNVNVHKKSDQGSGSLAGACLYFIINELDGYARLDNVNIYLDAYDSGTNTKYLHNPFTIRSISNNGTIDVYNSLLESLYNDVYSFYSSSTLHYIFDYNNGTLNLDNSTYYGIIENQLSDNTANINLTNNSRMVGKINSATKDYASGKHYTNGNMFVDNSTVTGTINYQNVIVKNNSVVGDASTISTNDLSIVYDDSLVIGTDDNTIDIDNPTINGSIKQLNKYLSSEYENRNNIEFYDGNINTKLVYSKTDFKKIPEDSYILSEKTNNINKNYISDLPLVKINSGSTEHTGESYKNIGKAINDCDNNTECELELLFNIPGDQDIIVPNNKNILMTGEKDIASQITNNGTLNINGVKNIANITNNGDLGVTSSSVSIVEITNNNSLEIENATISILNNYGNSTISDSTIDSLIDNENSSIELNNCTHNIKTDYTNHGNYVANNSNLIENWRRDGTNGLIIYDELNFINNGSATFNNTNVKRIKGETDSSLIISGGTMEQVTSKGSLSLTNGTIDTLKFNGDNTTFNGTPVVSTELEMTSGEFTLNDDFNIDMTNNSFTIDKNAILNITKNNFTFNVIGGTVNINTPKISGTRLTGNCNIISNSTVDITTLNCNLNITNVIVELKKRLDITYDKKINITDSNITANKGFADISSGNITFKNSKVISSGDSSPMINSRKKLSNDSIRNTIVIENSELKSTGAIIKDSTTILIKGSSIIESTAGEAIIGNITTLTLGEDDENLSTTEPSITSAVATADSLSVTTLNFYDGVYFGSKPVYSNLLLPTDTQLDVHNYPDVEVTSDMKKILLYRVGELEKVFMVNGANYNSFQAAINACPDGESTDMTLYKTIDLDSDVTIPEGKIIKFYFNGYSINKGEYHIINNGSFDIMDTDTSGGSLIGSIKKFLNLGNSNNVSKNIIIDSYDNGNNLLNEGEFTLQVYDEDNNKYTTVGVDEKLEDYGRYNINVNSTSTNLSAINNRIYINNISDGSYRLIDEYGNETNFTVTDSGKLVGNIKEDFSSGRNNKVSQAFAEIATVLQVLNPKILEIINPQTGDSILPYIIIGLISLSVIIFIIYKKKKRS